ncbi:MAG: hypothetical protein R3F11_26670 [Verrucomicrobiales bacterium]
MPRNFPASAFALAALATLAIAATADAVPIKGAEGKIVDFAIIKTATPDGLVVHVKPGANALTVPWAKLDMESLAENHPYIHAAYEKALAAGAPIDVAELERELKETAFPLEMGGASYELIRFDAIASPEIVICLVEDGAMPKLDPAWRRLARRSEAAILKVKAAPGGEADPVGAIDRLWEKAERPSLKGVGFVLVAKGGEAATYAWNYLSRQHEKILLLAAIGGRYPAEANQGTFFTPVLMLDTAPADGAAASNPNMTVGINLWKYYSTDGCRWCRAEISPDMKKNEALARAFADAVLRMSPYIDLQRREREVKESPLFYRIPGGDANFKSIDDTKSKLGHPETGAICGVEEKTGDKRRMHVWLPSAAFAEAWKDFRAGK